MLYHARMVRIQDECPKVGFTKARLVPFSLCSASVDPSQRFGEEPT